jgi:hypothetical protein
MTKQTASNFLTEPPTHDPLDVWGSELTPDQARLVTMLQFRRPHLSESEQEYIDYFIKPVQTPKDVPMKSWEDGFGNLFFQVGEQNKVMFTSHTDTVHHKDGKQEVFIDHDNILFVTEGVLGADDGSGNWLMLEMIKDGVEATYCFYRGEERGGLGSTYSVTNDAAFYSQYDIAIAFDRKGTGSIVIEQGAGECASREFALTLESALQMGYSPDPTGVFTDTATIAELVPECVNLSVGLTLNSPLNEKRETLGMCSQVLTQTIYTKTMGMTMFQA